MISRTDELNNLILDDLAKISSLITGLTAEAVNKLCPIIDAYVEHKIELAVSKHKEV